MKRKQINLKSYILHSRFYFLHSRFGQSALEILITIGILALALSAMVVVIYSSQSLSLDSQEANQALNLSRQNLENIVASSTVNFNNLSSSSSTQNEFLKEIIVENVDANTKKITSRVSWQADPARRQKVELTTLVTNWKIYQDSGGDSGGSGLTGDWTNPQTLGSVDLGPGNSATDLDVINKIVYLTAIASDSKKPDFFIVDATNGQSPVIVSNINTGPGLNAIDVAGNYAYVGNDSDDSQLQIIDVSNKSNPVWLTSFTLPAVSGSGAVGNAVFYYNSKVYVGTKRATGPEFHIIDVSNPANPQELGSYEVNADVNGIFVQDGAAYLATSDDSRELFVLNVNIPSNITQLGSFDAPASDDAKSVYLSGATLYLGRVSGSNDFMILDVSNPASIRQYSSSNLGGVSVNGIVVRDYLAFLATSDSNREFQAWNIASSSRPTLWSYFNFPQVASGLDYENNIVYVAVRSNDALRIITSR